MCKTNRHLLLRMPILKGGYFHADNLRTGIKGVLPVFNAYIVTPVAAIIIIAIFAIFLIDACNYFAMGPSLMALRSTITGLFLVSSIVVGVSAWKIIPRTAGRLVTVAVCGVNAMVTYVGIAFEIMVVFNY